MYLKKKNLNFREQLVPELTVLLKSSVEDNFVMY